MTYGTRTDGYPSTSKFLHWLIALCVLTTAPVALTMTRIADGPAKDSLYNFHKSLGVLILVLMILRLINRLAVGAPSAGAWWYVVPPGLCITVLVFAIGLLGYLFEQHVNPRLQQS